MKTYFFVGLLLCCSQALAGAGQPADQFITVGHAEAGTCNHTSLQAAVDAAPVLPIRVVAGTYDENITIVDQSLQIIGGFTDCDAAEDDSEDPEGVSILSPTSGPAILITGATGGDLYDVLISHLQVSNGLNAGFIPSGGLTVVGAVSLEITDSEFRNNTGFYGGGLYAGNTASVTTENTRFTNNSAFAGGGIYCDNCALTLDVFTAIDNNSAVGFEDNDIRGNGGGLYAGNESDVILLAGTVHSEIDLSGIHHNLAHHDGGGIYLSESSLFIYGGEFFGHGDDISPVSILNNHAQASGGGIMAEYTSDIEAVGLQLKDNTAVTSGAGVEVLYNSSLSVSSQAYYLEEGCWHVDETKCNQIIGNHIINTAKSMSYGGAIKSALSTIDINNTWFENNHTGGQLFRGNALFSESDDITIRNSVFFHNHHESGLDQSVLDFYHSDVDLAFLTVVDNDIDEGIIRLVDNDAVTFTLKNSIVHNNNHDALMWLYGNETFFHMSCMIVHENLSFVGQGSAINVNVVEPKFIGRSNGNFNLYSASVNAVDQCAIDFTTPGFDMNLMPRQFDVPGMGKGGAMNDFVFDMGAIEFQGNDELVDVIFKDSFDPIF